MIAIAPTDLDWFKFLSEDLSTRVINFWTPTPWNVKQLDEGDKFYFLLKSPVRKIGGYGTFRYYENMSARKAWNKFGRGNGVNSLSELVVKANKYGNDKFDPNTNAISL